MYTPNIKPKSTMAAVLSFLQFIAVIPIIIVYVATYVTLAILQEGLFGMRDYDGTWIAISCAYVCALMIFYGVKRFKLAGNAKNITQMARTGYGGRLPLETVARNLGKPLKRIYADVGRMFALHYITGAAVDTERREIVFDYAAAPKDAVESNVILTEANSFSAVPAVIFAGIWLNAYTFLNLTNLKNLAAVAVASIAAAVAAFVLLPKSKKLVESEKPIDRVPLHNSGDAEFDEKINAALAQLLELKQLSKRLADSNIGAGLRTISDTAKEILDHLKSNNSSIRNSRQFIAYYLPTSIKLFNEYAQLTAQPVKTANIVASIARIEEFTGRIQEIFQNELNNLYENKTEDITAEIAVMQNMIQGSLGAGEMPGNPER
ncbi:MAG: 5-bromo-4-chloroindolyl phosphate hydrolysis family protein [Clostridiales Family XIII bacterium]|jgi:5-bromo-4-chloroindolyl phosphate hydrolysis protein|nr:5-bromo-4-chloroindolyl phosphate hydrolysis family protein [Clostridiales Family XIII bacterium]